MRKQYSGIDIAKMICAIMVIAIHTQPFIRYVWLDRGAGVITRLAVPFFFVTTGFFLDFSETKKVKMCILRLLVLYAIWTIIYLPFSSLSIRKLLLTGVIGHLWYIPAAIVAVLLTYLVGQPKRSIVISGVLLLIGTLASTYQPLCSGIALGGTVVSDLFSTIGTRNGLFYGFFYVSLGTYIASERQNDRNWIGLLIVGIALLALESSIGVLALHTTSTILWLTTPIPVFALFMLAKRSNVNYNTIRIRKLSSMMYFSHCLWIIALKALGIEEGFILFVGVTVATIIFSYGVVRLSEKNKLFAWLF